MSNEKVFRKRCKEKNTHMEKNTSKPKSRNIYSKQAYRIKYWHWCYIYTCCDKNIILFSFYLKISILIKILTFGKKKKYVYKMK